MDELFEYKNYYCVYSDISSNLMNGGEKEGKKPVVSILMPIYNHPDYFKVALLSAINQDCNFEYEIIVVDNNHNDYQRMNQKIIEELNNEKVKYYINTQNIGAIGNWNRCIELATAPYVTFCHDDDTLLPTALSTLLLHLENIKNKKAAMFGAMNQIDSYGKNIKNNQFNRGCFFLKRKTFYKFTLYDFLATNITNGCGSLYYRECLIELGGFPINFSPCSDYALNVKYVDRYGGYYIEQKTFNYRITDSNDSYNCYTLIPKVDAEIWRNIMYKLPIPKFLIWPYYKVNLKRFIIYNKLLWDKNCDSVYQKNFYLNIIDKVIFKLYSMIFSLKKYTFY